MPPHLRCIFYWLTLLCKKAEKSVICFQTAETGCNTASFGVQSALSDMAIDESAIYVQQRTSCQRGLRNRAAHPQQLLCYIRLELPDVKLTACLLACFMVAPSSMDAGVRPTKAEQVRQAAPLLRGQLDPQLECKKVGLHVYCRNMHEHMFRLRIASCFCSTFYSTAEQCFRAKR